MRTFAKKPEATHQSTSARSPKPSRSFVGQSREVHSILHLHRKISNEAVLRLLHAAAEHLDASSENSASTGLTHYSSHIPLQTNALRNIQSKMKVNNPRDQNEQEADRIADEVLRQKVPEEKNERLEIQGRPSQQAVSGERELEEDIENRLRRSKGGGSLIVDQIRAFFEPRLQSDFSNVRVHTNDEAVRMNQEMGARAFTHGPDIYFGVGQYNPQSTEGRRLLAHELTHVVQQSHAGKTSSTGGKQTLTISSAKNETIQRDIEHHPDISGDFIITADDPRIETAAAFIRLVRRDLATKVQRRRVREEPPESDLMRVDRFDERLRACWNSELSLRPPSHRQIIVRLEGWGGRVSRFILISPRVSIPSPGERGESGGETLPPLLPRIPPPISAESGPPATCAQSSARNMYLAFVHNAERYGLPIGFLRQVGRDYRIVFGEPGVRYNINLMSLPRDELHGACGLEIGAEVGEEQHIRLVYEESVHAYLDLVADQPRFQQFIAEGERHYQGAPMRGGGTTSDPWQVFQEAAANYVGHRVSVWYGVFDLLSIFAASIRADPEVAERIRQGDLFGNLRDQYNNQMALRTFGYSDEGGLLGLGSEQAYTTRTLSPQMKAFLDHELLEDRIPDRFESVAGFQELLRSAGVSL